MLLPGILFVVICCTACNNDPKQITALTSKSALQLDKAEDAVIIYSQNGKTSFRLFAKEFIRNEQAKPPYTDIKKSLKVEFYNDSGIVDNILTAKYGRYYEDQQNILIRDSVVVVNRKGEQLNTEELVWNQSVRKFYTEKFVRITTPSQVLYGDGLEANEDFSWYEIKNLKGVVQVNKGELPE